MFLNLKVFALCMNRLSGKHSGSKGEGFRLLKGKHSGHRWKDFGFSFINTNRVLTGYAQLCGVTS